jgi:hypothetical protein
MSNAAAQAIEVGHVYYSGNAYDPHMDRVEVVTTDKVRVTYMGRLKSGGALANACLSRDVSREVFDLCYFRTHDDMCASYVDSGPSVAGLCRATLPGER